MPTYEYRCDNGHTFDRIQKMSDKPVTKCPVCGAKASRIISGGQGLIFKGTGFYITDYGKDGKGPRKEPGSAVGGETRGESQAGAKADSKTDAKTDSKADSTSDSRSERSLRGSEPKKEPKPAPAPKPGKSEPS